MIKLKNFFFSNKWHTSMSFIWIFFFFCFIYKKISNSRGRFIFSIHIFGSFTSASKTIPLFMHFKDSTLSARATIAQVFTTLQFMSNPNLHVIWSKMYIFSNYYTTIRPIWILKETWKKVISLNTILFAIKHATRGCGFS